eukprot:3437439-Prymnesium_polylepis.1
MRGLVERYMTEKTSRKRSRGEQASATDGAASEATKLLMDVFRGRGAGVEEFESDPATPKTPK